MKIIESPSSTPAIKHVTTKATHQLTKLAWVQVVQDGSPYSECVQKVSALAGVEVGTSRNQLKGGRDRFDGSARKGIEAVSTSG